MEEITWVATPASSNVSRIGYDKEKWNFFVQYSTGKTYMYTNFPVEMWDSALDSPSIGRFIFDQVKDKFDFKAVQ